MGAEATENGKPRPLIRRVPLKCLVIFSALIVVFIIALMWLIWPMGATWPDRRPIGVLFLASPCPGCSQNPRGWFNDRTLDVTGPDGNERFKKALLDYADNSIAVLKQVGAQGVIIWDVEGEQFPQARYVGDPRLLDRLAPEMAPVAGEFFKRFEQAGLRVGITIRPQQVVFDNGTPRQKAVLNMKRTLLEKMDFARTNWGVTVFYIDSNDSFLRPDEAFQLRMLAKERPDVLIIPEHHYLPYWAFTTPFVSFWQGKTDVTASLARKWFPHAFQALYVADASTNSIAASYRQGDILLFRAWYWNEDCRMVEQLESTNQ